MQEGDWVIANDSLENAPVTESLIQPPRNFDFLKPDLWPLWRKRFERYLTAANFSGKSESEKINTLCYIMGGESEAILAQAMPDTVSKTLADVLEAFTDCFCPKTNVLMERYRFNTRVQEPDESVNQFVTALKTLAESCQYGVMKDELIRDRIVVGLWDIKTSEALLQKSYLTLEEAVTIATEADPKLGETDKACAQGQVRLEKKGKALYQRVEKIMNRLSPRNFNFMAKQFRGLPIVSVEQLQGVVDQFYDKAIAEPSRVSLYGRLCKDIATVNVTDSNKGEGSKEDVVIFRKLIVTRCQMEFEKNFENVEASADPIKKKEVQLAHIGFIGELCKQSLLIVKIIHWCICHLLLHMSDVNLECLCKLLITTGENLESKDQNLDQYFKQMLDIISGRVPNTISPAVRYMLQDVIELKMNKWVPTKVDSSPKIVDQIPKQAETIHPVVNIQPVDTSTSTTQKEGKKRGSNPAGGGPVRTRVAHWVRDHSRAQQKETPKITNVVPPSMCDPRMHNANVSQWPRNLSANAPITVRPYTLPYTPRNDAPTANTNFLINVPEGGDYIPLERLY